MAKTDKNKIIEITTKFADGRKYKLLGKDVDEFFQSFQNKDQLMLLGLMFTPNLDVGLNWRNIKNENR